MTPPEIPLEAPPVVCFAAALLLAAIELSSE
jgi:hypothetical protein